MRYTYHYRVVAADGRISKASEQIAAADWLNDLQTARERYGNLGEFVAAAFPALNGDDPLVAAALVHQIDDLFHAQEPTAVAQFLLYCWSEFTAGRIGAAAWGAALGAAWPACERSLLDTVSLSEAQCLQMFAAAEPEALFRAGAGRKDWAAFLAAQPESLLLYRGVSTGSRYFANGLCWTFDPERAKLHAAHQVRQSSDIPGVIQARIAKSAVLAAFDDAAALVVDPRVSKQVLSTSYLSGSALHKFRQNWKKWQADERERALQAPAGR